jgi:hypothetical protein
VQSIDLERQGIPSNPLDLFVQKLAQSWFPVHALPETLDKLRGAKAMYGTHELVRNQHTNRWAVQEALAAIKKNPKEYGALKTYLPSDLHWHWDDDNEAAYDDFLRRWFPRADNKIALAQVEALIGELNNFDQVLANEYEEETEPHYLDILEAEAE